jgi:hypothetical protein
MVNIAAKTPGTPQGSEMHKRFERDGEKIKKKFSRLTSKRSQSPPDSSSGRGEN